MMKIKRYTSSGLSELASAIHSPPIYPPSKKNEVDEKGRELRRELIESALDPAQFIEFVEEKLEGYSEEKFLVEGEGEPEMPKSKMSESEFIDLPLDTMKELASTWETMPECDASEPTVWAYINNCLIRERLIAPCFFASNKKNGKDSTGFRRLEITLANNDDIEILKCARQIIRFWCGAREIRGTREMYQNCSPARAWWTCWIAKEAVDNLSGQNINELNVEYDQIIKILHDKRVWELLTERIVSNLTVLGDMKIRDGVLLFLLKEKRVKNSIFVQHGYKVDGNLLKILLRLMGQITTWRALGFFDSTDISDIIHVDIASHTSIQKQASSAQKNQKN